MAASLRCPHGWCFVKCGGPMAQRVALMMLALRGRLENGDVLKVVAPNSNGGGPRGVEKGA